MINDVVTAQVEFLHYVLGIGRLPRLPLPYGQLIVDLYASRGSGMPGEEIAVGDERSMRIIAVKCGAGNRTEPCSIYASVWLYD